MKVGIIGSGGREHAICETIKKSNKIDKIFCFPGNAGTKDIAENINIDLDNFEILKNFILEKKIDVVFGVGKMTKLTIDILGDIGRWYTSNSDLTIDLQKLLEKECIVLIKGSRFMKMEQIVRDLESRNA